MYSMWSNMLFAPLILCPTSLKCICLPPCPRLKLFVLVCSVKYIKLTKQEIVIMFSACYMFCMLCLDIFRKYNIEVNFNFSHYCLCYVSFSDVSVATSFCWSRPSEKNLSSLSLMCLQRKSMKSTRQYKNKVMGR